MKKGSYRIAQIGTFDLKNYGDILFPDILSTELSKYIDIDEIVLFSPMGGIKPFDSKKVFPISELENEHLKNAFDAIICGGGDVLRLDNQVVSDLRKYTMQGTSIQLWGIPVMIGEKYGVPVLLNAVGVPFPFIGIEKELVDTLLKHMQYISVRDSVSCQLLSECTNENISVIPDSVVLIEQTYSEAVLNQVYGRVKSELHLPDKYFVFQCSIFEEGISPTEYEAYLRQIEEWTDSQCVLMPIGYVHKDSEVLTSFNESLVTPFLYIERELSPIEMLSVLRNARCFVGTSLHGCLTSIIQGKTAVGLNYLHLAKLTGFFRMLGLSECEVNSIRKIKPETLNIRLSDEQKERIIRDANNHMKYMAHVIGEGKKAQTDKISISQGVIEALLNNRRENMFSKIYYCENNSYSEWNCDVFNHLPDAKEIEIHFDISHEISEIRFDPVENTACIISNLKAFCDDGAAIEVAGTNGQAIDNMILFSSTDPQIFLRLPKRRNTGGYIKCGISGISHPEYIREIGLARGFLNHEYKSKRPEFNEMQRRLTIAENKNKEYENRLIEADREKQYYQHELQTIQNAALWKISWPLRKVLDKIKEKTGFMKPGIQAPAYVRTIRFLKKNGIRATVGRIWIEVAGYKPQSRKQSKVLRCNYSTAKKQRTTTCLGFIHDDAEIVTAEEILVSVVIPTKNGGKDFLRLMKMLVAQKGIKQIEIVIVDSGSTDRTVEIAKEYGAKIIPIKPEEFSHSYARNLGVNNASGDFVLVMTQDAMPTSLFWIRNFHYALTHQPDIAAVSCGEFPRVDADLYHRAFTWNHYRFLGSYENDRINVCPSSQDADSMHRAAQLSDIACFMKRETAVNYPYQGEFAEDLDLGMRLLKDGHKIGFLGHELAIHSHNRNAYYYLRRRFVEFMTLKKLFADQDYIRTEFDGLICEIAYLLEKLDAYFQSEDIVCFAAGIKYAEFREAFIAEFKKMKNGSYKQGFDLELDKVFWLDEQTRHALTELFGNCKKLGTLSGQYKGTMVLAMEGYLNILFNYMSECYEYVNGDIFDEFRECIGKIVAGLIGTYFAYCNLTEIENGTVVEEHQMFFKRIGAGV